MKLVFNQPHKSIQNFEDIEVPDFTVITGVNGSGKTHLLKCLSPLKGVPIQIDDPNLNSQLVHYYDWNNLMRHSSNLFEMSTIIEEEKKILNLMDLARKEYQSNIEKLISKYRIHLPSNDKIGWSITELPAEQIECVVAFDNDRDTNELYNLIQHIAKSVKDLFISKASGDMTLKPILNDLSIVLKPSEVTNLKGKALIRQSFRSFYHTLFEQDFSRMFMLYHRKKTQNWINYAMQLSGEGEYEYLEPEAFKKKHGEPPWDFVNRVFTSANIPFEITYPSGIEIEQFLPELIHKKTGAEIEFRDLSSGEMIIMSLALCRFYAEDKRQIIQKPKVLLFDEIDAPLHPSMSRQLVETIKKVLVEGEGIKVIMTTHSPSTIAVCPEESVHVMEQGYGLKKVSKAKAISILTADVPTLSVNYDGRRQVFVEDKSDAKIYETLYEVLKKKLDSERSLIFIPIGKKGKGKTGCDAVKSIVGQLHRSGNQTAYGLIDWDQKNKSDLQNGIFVSAEGKRYSIENCMLDPLLLAALIIKVKLDEKAKLGLEDDENYLSLQNFDEERLQDIVNCVEKLMFGDDEKLTSEKVEVEYLDGFSLDVCKELLLIKGHDLEEKSQENLESLLKGVVPCLNHYHQQGALVNAVIEQVLPDFPGFLPKIIFDDMKSLLEFEKANLH